ncbi:MAG: hypothetical protein RBU27_08340, partial [Bacteroidota bacterium]|nr:hypothetical protein [Bacteroidota bacterium]
MRERPGTSVHRRHDGGAGAIRTDTLTFHLPARIPNDSVYLWTEFDTYFGNNDRGQLRAHEIRADERGNVAFAGWTDDGDLPVTPNAYQPNSNLPVAWDPTSIVAYYGRLNCDGIHADYLSYYGTGQRRAMRLGKFSIGPKGFYLLKAIPHDSLEIAFHTPVGEALEFRYPLDTAFVYNWRQGLSRFDTSGRLVYRSWLSAKTLPNYNPGWGHTGVRIGADDCVYIWGYGTDSLPYIQPGVFIDTVPSGVDRAPFLLKLTPECDSVVYGTYLPDSTWIGDVDADAMGFASIVGQTKKAMFPVKNSWQPSLRDTAVLGDLFVMRLSPSGDTLVFSTYLGGSHFESAHGFQYIYDSDNNYGYRCTRVTNDGRTYVAGLTTSFDLPLHNPLQTTYRSWEMIGNRHPDLALAGFGPDGDILFSSYWGGDGREEPITMDLTSCGDLLITGYTFSRDFPLVHSPAYAGTFSTTTGVESKHFMLLIDPEQVAMHASLLFPDDLYTTDLHYTENGYMHRIGFASGGFPVFNGFQDRAHSPGS